MKVLTKGLIIVYTGEGEGKTTAALGLVLRSAGYEKKILIVQFGKARFSGEVKSLKKFSPYIKLIQGGKGFVKILDDKLSFQEHKEAAQKTFEELFQEMISGKWDIVIADEIIGAQEAKLLTLSQVLQLIKKKPPIVDLVLTGRHTHSKIITLADLVTEMKKIKHPFDRGVLAKEGIDY